LPRELKRYVLPKLKMALLACAVLLVTGVYALSHPMHDFMEYWTAAHLLVQHKNPYSLLDMLQTQKSLGWAEQDPLMFVSPPWALTLILPLGFMSSYSLAWVLWVLILFVCAAASSFLLMNIYFADLRIPEITDTTLNRSLFAFTFYPVILCLKYAQTAPFILLGLTGYLHFTRKQQRTAAGLLFSLTLIKPQLSFLLLLAVLFRSVQKREWKTPISAVGVLAAMTGVACSFDPLAFRHYHELIATPYLRINPSGMVGIVRRGLNHGDITVSYWMQFVLPILGVVWFAYYWRRRRHNWNWTEQLPVLVTVSVLTAAYGWIFDQTVLAIPIIALAAAVSRERSRLPWNLVISYTVLNCALMLLMVLPPLTYIPTPLALIAIYIARHRNGHHQASKSSYLSKYEVSNQ
jgi:hypothetical protein